MPVKRTKKKQEIVKQQTNNSFAVFVAWILILWSSFYFARKYLWQSYTYSKLLIPNDSFVSQIAFPSLNTTRTVVTTHIENGEWLLVDNAANYVYESARPGENKSIIIYGHNTPSIFGNLRNLNLDDSIILTTDSGKTYHYQVTTKQVVTPDQVEILVKDYEALVIYTCTGFLDSKRLIIEAKPIFKTPIPSISPLENKTPLESGAKLLNKPVLN